MQKRPVGFQEQEVFQKRQRCPRCGAWLMSMKLMDWKAIYNQNRFAAMFTPISPAEIHKDEYGCKSCGYMTTILGSANRRMQSVLRDIIQTYMTEDERKSYAVQANDEEALLKLYSSLLGRLQINNEINGMAALIIGIMPQAMRDSVILETQGMGVPQILEYLESRLQSLGTKQNFGDLAIALTMS